MPGPFTHIVLASHALYQALPPAMADILENRDVHLLVGANFPDMPYLASADEWGNEMHYAHANRVITKGVQLIRDLAGEARKRSIAWFCGHLSHMAADATIHPVVNAMAGKYTDGPECVVKHQVIETNWDAYSFHEYLKVGSTIESEYISGLKKRFHDLEQQAGLEYDISRFCSDLVQGAYPELGSADPKHWISRSMDVIDWIGEEGNRDVVAYIARLAGRGQLLQIPYEKVNRAFIDRLVTPNYGIVTFNELANQTLANIAMTWVAFWNMLATGEDPTYPLASHWDLDSGMISASEFLFQEGERK